MELDLTLEQVSEKIRETSQDLPSGDTSGSVEMQIRSLGLLKTRMALAVSVRVLENGQKIYLRDIAAVGEEFEEAKRGRVPRN